ncbi:MAG: bestrophin family protein [Flavobacteriales bacterium]|nr:bestrophin family protein [Flavobacteriales bacterium]MBK7481751.1 bestrophin family protein [Flavobacteriales bacterium]
MKAYDSHNWFRALAIHKSDTFRVLWPAVIFVGLFTAGAGWLETNYFHISKTSYVNNLTVMHSLLGFAISMLLVFRTNSAYDRWWEGRKLWGQLVNVSRNTAIKIAAMLPPDDSKIRTFYARLIGEFAAELRRHLLLEKTRMEMDSEPHPEIPDFDQSKHVPAQVALLMQQRVVRAHREGLLTGDQLIILDKELVQYMEICGACERIKNTPIPYSYSSFIKKFIVVYVFTLPFGVAFSLGYLAIPVVMFIFYVMASLELIAEEIEDPFGDDPNDLPMKRLATVIGQNAEEILR